MSERKTPPRSPYVEDDEDPSKICIGRCQIDVEKMYCPACDRRFKALPKWLQPLEKPKSFTRTIKR